MRQPLLAANIVEVKDCPWDYQLAMYHEGGDIKVSFCSVPTPEVQAEILVTSDTNAETPALEKTDKKEQGKRSKFGPQPRLDDPNFDFKKELDQLPFHANMGEVDMSKLQQSRFLEFIYNHQSIFLLCDEDLSLCDCLKQAIPTTTDKPVYLPHHTILVQLQAEVCKCLDTWLKQGVI